MREHQIEKYLVEQVEELGGRAIKLTSSANRGLPDRMCFFPGGILWFVELKTRTGRLSALQAKQILSLRELGQNVTIIDSIMKVNVFIKRRKNELRLSVRFNRNNRRNKFQTQKTKSSNT